MRGATKSIVTSTPTPPTPTIKPFSQCTWTEVADILQLHYSGQIDISDVWSVGDTKTDIPLSAISASSLGGDAQNAQLVDFVIIGMKHDTLSSDGVTKAAVTLAQKDCLLTTGKMFSDYDSYSYARYSLSPRRTWLNSDYFNALPSDLRAIIKPVDKLTCYPTDVSNTLALNTTSETCWLASNYELMGENFIYGNETITRTIQDGTQYQYYNTQSHRIKKLGQSGSAQWYYSRTGEWFMPSWVSEPFAIFVRGWIDGTSAYSASRNDGGIAPHICI